MLRACPAWARKTTTGDIDPGVREVRRRAGVAASATRAATTATAMGWRHAGIAHFVIATRTQRLHAARSRPGQMSAPDDLSKPFGAQHPPPSCRKEATPARRTTFPSGRATGGRAAIATPEVARMTCAAPCHRSCLSPWLSAPGSRGLRAAAALAHLVRRQRHPEPSGATVTGATRSRAVRASAVGRRTSQKDAALVLAACHLCPGRPAPSSWVKPA